MVKENDQDSGGPRKPNAEKYLRLLGRTPTSATETTHTLTSRGAGDAFAESTISLSESDMAEKISQLQERLEKAERERPEVFENHDITSKAIVKSAQEAWAKLNSEGSAAALGQRDVIGLEAIVETDGSRPTLRFDEDGELTQEPNSRIQDRWKVVLNNLKGSVESIAKRVCRVNLDGAHKGTGFAFGDHLILTNRHVLQSVADFNRTEWTFRGRVTADFGSGHSESSQSFDCIASGIKCGDHEINLARIQFDKFDYAVLRCKPAKGRVFPAPIVPERRSDLIHASMPVYALGFPGEPQTGQYAGTLLTELFGHKYGIKRFSPGEIDFGMGHEVGDIHHTVVTYDSSTLPGSSGSVVLDVSQMGISAVGLHFAGSERGNYAHVLAAPNFRENLFGKGIEYPSAQSS